MTLSLDGPRRDLHRLTVAGLPGLGQPAPAMSEAKAIAELHECVRSEIRAAGGAIPFSRFMDLALYTPGLGYYERSARPVGRGGDFYTSVSVGPVFGELLAFRYAEWLAPIAASNVPPEPLQIVEAGAHDGRLARDILGWLQTWRPALVKNIEYWIVEPSAARREWQVETLRDFARQVRWVGDLAALPPVHGVVFANELLDAFPVHRVGWDAQAKTWFEWGVTETSDRFAWARLDTPPPSSAVPELPEALRPILPDGFSTETCPAAEQWWQRAAKKLACGQLLALDYGLERLDFFAPQRFGGTLRAYCRHRPAEDVLARPGEQDITAQVNFTALRQAGEAAGLQTETFTRQGRWLTGITGRIGNPAVGFAAWDSTRVRQFQTLTHPEHLGHAFSVLVQGRKSPQ